MFQTQTTVVKPTRWYRFLGLLVALFILGGIMFSATVQRADAAVSGGNVAAIANGAPVSFAIVGGAGDELRLSVRRLAVGAADGEVGAAAAVDPETALVDTPGAATDAG